MEYLQVPAEGRAEEGRKDHGSFAETHTEEERGRSSGSRCCYQYDHGPRLKINAAKPKHVVYFILWNPYITRPEKRSVPLRRPDIFIPILDKSRIVFIFCLELCEAASQDVNFMWYVRPSGL